MTDMAYIKVYKDYIGIAEALDNGQRGRLFLAIMQYANGIEPEGLSGAEYIAFLSIKAQVDRDRSEYSDRREANRENGRKGGRPRKAIAFEEEPKNQTVFDENPKRQDKEKEKEKDKEGFGDIPYPPDTLELYATTAFPHMTVNNLRELISYLDELPEDVIRHAIDEASAHGGATYAYCRKILNGYVADEIHSIEEAKARDSAIESRKRGKEKQQEQSVEDNPLLRTPFY